VASRLTFSLAHDGDAGVVPAMPDVPALPASPTLPTRYVLFVFGDHIATHCQAWLALLTTMAQAGPSAEFVVLTDRPAFYAWFGARVDARLVTEATMRAWKGDSGFFWRMKIEAVRTAAGLGPAHLVYLDSDILARQPLAPLSAALAAGAVFMHEREFALGASRRRGHRELARLVVGTTAAGVAVTMDSAMWNAGVVAVGAGQHGLLDQALERCDAFCRSGTHTLLEQLAFSVSLSTTGRLGPASAWFDHYWGNKPGFQESITAQLAELQVRGLGVDDAIAFVAEHPIRRPLMVRRRWWNRYFTGLAGADD
jgi:hypothetical protein